MRTVFRKALTILLLPVYVVSAEAAEWKIDPKLSLKAGYNDNIRQSIDDEVSSAEATFSPSSRFSVETAESGLSGDLRFDFRRFEDDSNLDDNNILVSRLCRRKTDPHIIASQLDIPVQVSYRAQHRQQYDD